MTREGLQSRATHALPLLAELTRGVEQAILVLSEEKESAKWSEPHSGMNGLEWQICFFISNISNSNQKKLVTDLLLWMNPWLLHVNQLPMPR